MYASNDGFIVGKDSNQNAVIWNYESNAIIIGTANQERLRITSNGRLGIGTTNPQSVFDLRGDLTITGSILKIDGSPYYNNNQWSNSTNNIYFNQGFIGIGTTNPQSQLHLSSLTQSTAVNMRFTDATTGYTSNDGFIIGKDSNQNAVI